MFGCGHAYHAKCLPNDGNVQKCPTCYATNAQQASAENQKKDSVKKEEKKQFELGQVHLTAAQLERYKKLEQQLQKPSRVSIFDFLLLKLLA